MHRDGNDAAHGREKSKIIFPLLIKLEILIPKNMWHEIHPDGCCSSFENPRMKPYNILVKQVDKISKIEIESRGLQKSP